MHKLFSYLRKYYFRYVEGKYVKCIHVPRGLKNITVLQFCPATICVTWKLPDDKARHLMNSNISPCCNHIFFVILLSTPSNFDSSSLFIPLYSMEFYLHFPGYFPENILEKRSWNSFSWNDITVTNRWR